MATPASKLWIAAVGAFALAQAVSAQPAPGPLGTGGGTLLELPGNAPPAAPTPAPAPPALPAPQTPLPAGQPGAATPSLPPVTPTLAPGNVEPPGGPPPVAAPPPRTPPATLPEQALPPGPGPTSTLPPPASEGTAATPPPSGVETNDVLAKTPDIMPMHLGDTSLMFSKKDLEVMQPFIDMYEAASHTKKTANPAAEEDLSSLLQSLRHEDTPNAPPPRLPNLYLGSILYYSPSHWSVWLNGLKLGSAHNAPANEFYITQLSRAEMEVQWRPRALLDVPDTWKARTDNGKNPLPNVSVDEAKGIITLRMRPNQTFLPKSLNFHEGMLIPDMNPSAPVAATAPAMPAPQSFAPQAPAPQPAAPAPAALPVTPAAPAPMTSPPPHPTITVR